MTARLLTTAALGAMLLAATPALADRKARQNDKEEMGDPNRQICRTETETGSRLKQTRRCHTAAQWAQIKREVRATTERVQAFKPQNP